MNLPDKFVENMKKILGDEYLDYEKSFEDKRLYGLRINTMKITLPFQIFLNPKNSMVHINM